MNTRQNLIIDNQLNKIITRDVEYCRYNKATQKYDISFSNGKTYSYNYNRITWLSDPRSFDPKLYHIVHNGRQLRDISAIIVFDDVVRQYWHIIYSNGWEQDYDKSELEINKSCLDDKTSKNVLSYLDRIANEHELKGDDGTKLLAKQYEKLNDFVSDETVLATYLNPSLYRNTIHGSSVPVFPFGCNASQFKAVKAALENRISIIQGPPGTGKTQTILNIIANLLIAGKTVQVVSNNNSATENVLEKLSSDKYGLGFIVAPLGSSDNKKNFIDKQTGMYPDISNWASKDVSIQDVESRSKSLHEIFSKQERLAVARQELEALRVELRYFEQYALETNDLPKAPKLRKSIKAEKILRLWNECLNYANNGRAPSFFFKLKSVFIYGISDWKFYDSDISVIIKLMQSLFYRTKERELSTEIDELQKYLSEMNADKLISEFTQISMQHLKSILANKYNKRELHIFTDKDFINNYEAIQKEYPVVLSTTFSARSSLCKDAVFDYLIMDEASQVDVATGALALSSARNVVIVGDLKQLPNVVTKDVAQRTDAIFESFNINESYRFTSKSFLKSMCELFPDAPQTLLREHYRCHPKIINFCNQKFYGGELIIMSEDNGEDDVISVMRTVVGDHARDHMNQRQIDSIKQEVLPKLSFRPAEIGIIAPYNAQIKALRNALSDKGIDIETVHKFQGREKDAIILTTVDNVVTDFSDDPYLLNVAVSRAKKKLCLVVSGNEQPADSNIADLISYIEYNNFSISDSRIYSVFDYLYSQYTESRMKYLSKYKRVSEFDSENLMYVLIQDTIRENGLDVLKVVCHFPLNMLIRDPILLNDDECRYAMNSATHLDFLIYNRVSKKPILAIEVDGFHYHKEGTEQYSRDRMKDHIMELYGIPLLRFATNGSGEKKKLESALADFV